MSNKRNILKAQLIGRWGDRSWIDPSAIGTDMHEVFVQRSDVSTWPADKKEAIFALENCVLLTNQENLYISQEQNRKLGYLLMKRVGRNKIQIWLDSLPLRHRIDLDNWNG
jgi:hypothetical protein